MRKAAKVKNNEDATKWERHRNRGILFWKVVMGLLTALFTCLLLNITLILWLVFYEKINIDDWISSIINQNVVGVIIGFLGGYYLATESWEAREEQYQIYLKSQSKKNTD